MTRAATYTYTDEEDNPLFQVRRRPKPGGGKTFAQFHHDGDGWRPGLNGQSPVPYRLPRVMGAVAVGETVYIVEGEKDADALVEAGHTATTNPGGAGKWRREYREYLQDADVVIVFDRDEPGRRHALDVEAKLEGVARQVRFARARKGKDAADHLAAGHGVDELIFGRPRGQKKPEGTQKATDAIRKGERNNALTRYAGTMRKGGLAEAEMAAALKAVNAARCEPPLGDAEVETIARSVARYEPATTGERRVTSVPAGSVQPKRKKFVVAKTVPRGAVTIMVGRQGTGKSTLTLRWAADGSLGILDGDLRGEPFTTLIVSYEDDAETTMTPRLLAAGADLDRVRYVTAHQGGMRTLVGLPDDLPAIASEARTHGAALVVIDPISAALPPGVDSHKDASVRRVLAPLAQFAEEADLAVLALAHFTKSGDADALARTVGSVAFTAAARSVVAFAYDPEDEDSAHSGRRVLAHAKSNVGPLASSLAYVIEGCTVRGDDEDIPTSRAVLVGSHNATADALLVRADAADRDKRDEAVEFLRAELKPGDEVAVRDLRKAATDAGLEWSAVKRAKERLSVASRKLGFGTSEAAGWVWRLENKERP